MDPEEFKKKKRKVAGITKVETQRVYLNPEYTIKTFENTKTTKTAWVRVAEISSDKPGNPAFILRWDKKADTIDADIHLNRDKRNDLWSKQGYTGHHPQKVKDKIFNVKIETPQGLIYEGELNIGLLIEQQMKLSVIFTDNVETEHQKSGK